MDNLLGACECSRFLKKFFNKLAATFKIRDLGSPSSFLGIDVCYDSTQRCVALSQQKYILDLATKFNLPPTLRPVTPIRSDYYSQLETAHPQPILEEVPYRELVGALIFVMVCTRPDVAFAVACLTQYFSAPRALHWEQALRCLGYLVGTSLFGILLGAGGPDELVAFSDSDWRPSYSKINWWLHNFFRTFCSLLELQNSAGHHSSILHRVRVHSTSPFSSINSIYSTDIS